MESELASSMHSVEVKQEPTEDVTVKQEPIDEVTVKQEPLDNVPPQEQVPNKRVKLEHDMEEPMDHDGMPSSSNGTADSLRQSRFHAVQVGKPNTSTYRCFMKDDDGKLVSLWHDIPLYAEMAHTEKQGSLQLYNMVVEVPRYSNARLEVNHREPMNPISHAFDDDGNLSYAHNIFPMKGYPFNYGYFPQTWTDNRRKADQFAPGDGDLLDAIDITQKTRKVGDVVKVKVLGATAFIVDNRLDWKIVCIEANDPLAEKINEVYHLEFVMPGIIRAIHEFFFLFNKPTKNELTDIAFKGSYRRVGVVNQILTVSHSLWKNIITRRQAGIPDTTIIACRQPEGVEQADLSEWEAIVDQKPDLSEPAEQPDFVNSYYFVTF